MYHGDKKRVCPVCQEMIVFLEKRAWSLAGERLKQAKEQQCLGGQRRQGRLAPAAGPGTSFCPRGHQCLVALLLGQDALVIPLRAGGDKTRVFLFLSASVCNKHCNHAALSVISFATMLPVGICNCLTHICLRDDLAQIKGELGLGSMHLWAGSP